MAGRSIPSTRPIPKSPAVTAAPVEPGATRAPHSPFLTSFAPTDTDASFSYEMPSPDVLPSQSPVTHGRFQSTVPDRHDYLSILSQFVPYRRPGQQEHENHALPEQRL